MEVLLYHAGLSDGVRRRTQETFMEAAPRVIVATNAFGMGVDKPDVRSVIHFNVPRTMEAYYQEAGRAGRDGQAAQCVLLFSYGDVRIQEFLLEQSYPERQLLEEVYGLIVSLSRRQPEVPLRSLLPHRRHGSSMMQVESCLKILERTGYIERLTGYDSGEDAIAPLVLRLAQDAVTPQRLQLDDAALQRRKRHEIRKMRQMVGYANARQCRRQRILRYFGETWEQSHCGACDYCLQDRVFEATPQHPPRALTEGEWLTVQKILSCVARMEGRYGKARVVQVLMGSRAKELRSTHLARLSTYGILQGTARPVIETYIEALLGAECLHVVGDEFPKLDLTPQGWAVMRRQQDIRLALPGAVPAPAPEPKIPTVRPVPVVDSATAAPSEPDAALVERLRAQRTALARAESVPPYTVFHDRTLYDMAACLPTTRDELLAIHGIGHAKADKYGPIFLDLIREYTMRREG
jgi:ATP-dependent DNA helicase RecQ